MPTNARLWRQGEPRPALLLLALAATVIAHQLPPVTLASNSSPDPTSDSAAGSWLLASAAGYWALFSSPATSFQIPFAAMSTTVTHVDLPPPTASSTAWFDGQNATHGNRRAPPPTAGEDVSFAGAAAYSMRAPGAFRGGLSAGTRLAATLALSVALLALTLATVWWTTRFAARRCVRGLRLLCSLLRCPCSGRDAGAHKDRGHHSAHDGDHDGGESAPCAPPLDVSENDSDDDPANELEEPVGVDADDCWGEPEPQARGTARDDESTSGGGGDSPGNALSYDDFSGAGGASDCGCDEDLAPASTCAAVASGKRIGGGGGSGGAAFTTPEKPTAKEPQKSGGEAMASPAKTNPKQKTKPVPRTAASEKQPRCPALRCTMCDGSTGLCSWYSFDPATRQQGSGTMSKMRPLRKEHPDWAFYCSITCKNKDTRTATVPAAGDAGAASASSSALVASGGAGGGGGAGPAAAGATPVRPVKRKASPASQHMEPLTKKVTPLTNK